MATIPDYPFQKGISLTAAGIHYGLFDKMQALERLEKLESIGRPNN